VREFRSFEKKQALQLDIALLSSGFLQGCLCQYRLR
jgi:hypothetical protein